MENERLLQIDKEVKLIQEALKGLNEKTAALRSSLQALTDEARQIQDRCDHEGELTGESPGLYRQYRCRKCGKYYVEWTNE